MESRDNEKDTETEDLCNLFGANLKKLRTKSGYSQVTLSVEADITHNFINDLEHGRRGVSMESLAKLAKALKVQPYRFFLPLQIDSEYPDQITEMYETYVHSFKEHSRKLNDILHDSNNPHGN